MKREQLVLLVAVLFFAGLGTYYFRVVRAKRPVAKKTTISETKPLAAKALPQGAPAPGPAGAPVEVIDERTAWGRNPFLTEAEEKGMRELQVRVIIVGPPKAVASLDGNAVIVGEKVGEATVAEIRADTVVLEKGGQQKVLKMSEPSIPIEIKEGQRR